MANLLSPQYKKELQKRDVLKVVYVYLVGLGVIFFLAAIFLTPSFLLAGSKRLTARENLELLSASISSKESEEFGKILEEASVKIRILSTENEGEKNYNVLAALVEEKPAGVSINSLELRSDEEEKSVLVKGLALTRGTMLQFAENLEGSELVRTADLPISTLAQDRNIDFEILVILEDLP